MTNDDWADYVADHLADLVKDTKPETKRLVALFELKTEFENGGLTQYLVNSSGDHFADVKEAIENAGLDEGRAWVRDVESVYGGPLPEDRDARIERIATLPGFEEGKDPFDGPHDRLEQLLSKLSEVALSLMPGRVIH